MYCRDSERSILRLSHFWKPSQASFTGASYFNVPFFHVAQQRMDDRLEALQLSQSGVRWRKLIQLNFHGSGKYCCQRQFMRRRVKVPAERYMYIQDSTPRCFSIVRRYLAPGEGICNLALGFGRSTTKRKAQQIVSHANSSTSVVVQERSGPDRKEIIMR
jgi:hypothetical protein